METASPDMNKCRVCDAGGMVVFHEQDAVPTNSCILLPSKEDALSCRKGTIRLGYCRHCGFIFNLAYDPTLPEYSQRYEETQGFSDTFNHFQKQLGHRLVEKHRLTGKHILEIGCGKGEFLALICEIGNNRGTGIDPAYIDARNPSQSMSNIRFIKDFYSEKYAHIKADFVICKMTLEHIPDPYRFVGMIRKTIGDQLQTLVFFQVPDVTRIIEDCAFEDIYYEHCSYFRPNSMSVLFERSGFEVTDITTDYGDQYLMLEAKPAVGHRTDLSALPKEVDGFQSSIENFRKRYDQKLAAWRREIRNAKNKGENIVLWGSGSKAVSFLNSLGISDEIEMVVDINPYKHGFYMAGTGQEIVGPQSLVGCRPDKIIVMNPIYCDEISRDLKRQNLDAELIPLNVF